jgi:hypothetical protein
MSIVWCCGLLARHTTQSTPRQQLDACAIHWAFGRTLLAQRLHSTPFHITFRHRSPLSSHVPALPQVLAVLADPGHPQLVAKLRFVAAAITPDKHLELRAWLDGGLLPLLLDILRALPLLGLSDRDAAEACAAAAAGVSNVLAVAYARTALTPKPDPVEQVDELRQQACSLDIFEALVTYGMLNPAAAEQLPPGREISMIVDYGNGPAALYSAAYVSQLSREFWTPWTICTFTLRERLLVGKAPFTKAFARALTPLVTPSVFEQLLNLAIRHPCGERSAPPQQRVACLHGSRKFGVAHGPRGVSRWWMRNSW